MIGAAISAGIGAVGSIFGAIKAGKERRKMNAFINQQSAENEAKYNRDYYGDYLQRADSQAVIKQMRDTLKDSTQQAQSTAAITGATPEAQLAQMDSQNQAVGDTMSKISAMGAQFKDRVDDRYMARKDSINQMKFGQMEGRAQSGETLLGNATSLLGSSVAGLVPNLGVKKTGLEGLGGNVAKSMHLNAGKVGQDALQNLRGRNRNLDGVNLGKVYEPSNLA